MKLACGASVFAAYLSAEKRSTVFIYELPSGNFLTRVNGFHLGTIYDIDWSINDKYIMSASNDCTAQIWSISKDSDVRTSSDRTSGSPSTSNKNVFSSVILPHPCFIYSCKFCPQIELQYMIFTGAFDGIIRIWSVKNCFEPHSSYSRDPELLREIDGHQGHVLSLAFKMFPSTISTSPSLSSSVEPTVPHLITSNDQQTTKHWAKLTLFSSGSNGSITLWRHTDDGTGSDPSNWMSVSRIRIPELKNVPINCIKMSPSGSKILLCCRDGLLRMIDFDLYVLSKLYFNTTLSSTILSPSLMHYPHFFQNHHRQHHLSYSLASTPSVNASLIFFLFPSCASCDIFLLLFLFYSDSTVPRFFLITINDPFARISITPSIYSINRTTSKTSEDSTSHARTNPPPFYYKHQQKPDDFPS